MLSDGGAESSLSNYECQYFQFIFMLFTVLQ